jgi:hypothetical protein
LDNTLNFESGFNVFAFGLSNLDANPNGRTKRTFDGLLLHRSYMG